MTSPSVSLALFCFSCQISYWSKFHVNIITGSRIMTIFFYKGLTRNPEIGNTHEFFPISGDWGELWIPNLARMSLIECYWMLQNSRVTVFTVFELLRESQLGGGGKITPSPSQIRVKYKNSLKKKIRLCSNFLMSQPV